MLILLVHQAFNSAAAYEWVRRQRSAPAQVGAGIQVKGRKTAASQRPPGGYAVLVRPARRGVRFQPFVARPDGSRRALTADEALYLGRQVPRARRRIL